MKLCNISLSNNSLGLLLEPSSRFFQTAFMFGLLLFWLCIFHGLRQTERGLYRFYLPKFLMVGTLWFSALTMAVLQASNELRDPSFSYQINTAHYQSFQVKFSRAIKMRNSNPLYFDEFLFLFSCI